LKIVELEAKRCQGRLSREGHIMAVAEKRKQMAKAIALADSGGEGKGSQVTGFFTRTADFLHDVRGEMRKVVTPSWKEVQATTAVVLVTVFAFAAFFYGVDWIFGHVMQAVFHGMNGNP
jgi:preprotein translocase subunit SecE